MSTTVNIRCAAKGCNRLLLSVDAWPHEGSPQWAGSEGVWAERCQKHNEIRHRETIAEADARRAAKELPPVDRGGLMVFVRWSTLRPRYLDAKHRGRAVDYFAP